MSEVAKAVEEVVDAMVANLSFDEGTKPNANPIPEKSTETDTHKSESSGNVEEEPVPAPLSDSPPSAKVDNKGTPKSALKERRDSSGEVADGSTKDREDATAPEGTVISEEQVASGPVPISVGSESEPVQKKKKKLSSFERRKLRDQKAAAATEAGITEAGTAASSTATATKEPSQQASDEVVAEPPLPKRNKKTKQPEGAADKPVAPAEEEPTKTTGGPTRSPNLPASAPALEDAADAKAPAKKETKRAKAAPAKTAAPEPLVMAPTTLANTAAASGQTEAPASEAKPAAQEGKKKNKTGAKAEPAAASNTISSAAASASADRATTDSAAAIKEQATKPAVLRAPALKVDQHIALHAMVTLLQQEVLARATVVTANTGALKTHLLHGITRLGYTCVEGSPQSFQRVGWHTTDDCLDYSPPILKHPEQFLQSAKTKGDLKLEAPALFVQLRAYPDFGADSPLLQGAKAFKTVFLRTIDEVAAGESDAFVFICAEKVYQEFALQAVPALPSTTAIQRHALTFALAHTAKNSAVSNLRSLVSRVENAAGECYIVAAILP